MHGRPDEHLQQRHFRVSLGTTRGGSDLGTGLDDKSGSERAGSAVFLSGLVGAEPTHVRMTLLSGSVDPFIAFQTTLVADSRRYQYGYPLEPLPSAPSVPLPAGLPLLAGALGVLELVRRRRRAG